jgi:regulator of cell morphogenesis and NO signaling
MEQLQSKTLAQIVNENHHAATLFEKYGLDFCCQGKRSLQVACEEKKLSVAEISSELKSIAQKQARPLVDLDKITLKELVNYIISVHHSYVKQEGPQVVAYLQKIVSKHGDRHNELRKILEIFVNLKHEMDSHMQKEELILFPRIVGLETFRKNYNNTTPLSYLEAPVLLMEHEHDDAGKLLGELRNLTNNYLPPADACTTYRLTFAALRSFETDLHKHIHLENNILFPKALELFRKTKEASLN